MVDNVSYQTAAADERRIGLTYVRRYVIRLHTMSSEKDSLKTCIWYNFLVHLFVFFKLDFPAVKVLSTETPDH